ncbi:MAG: asparagine synthase (glutamine-hydrolyzing) [Planctomycetota bacterium]|nr:asparagine synthase (glutamine-hydrolyzing) [Planctomycetota bacterium]
MCGICGIVSEAPDEPVALPALLAMRDALVHRGPDAAGVCVRPGVGLAAQRLAVLDRSPRGQMPMADAQGRYWIVYNGEVYNYRELRSRLAGRGHRFHSDTDTEVVLQLYAEEGPAMLDRLQGMFAFAIWDDWERQLFLARDRLGIKPLYYAQRHGTFYFASEAKAFWQAGVQPEFDPSTWEELLCYRFVAGAATPFRGISRLLPGHTLTVADGHIRVRRWWNLAERIRETRTQLPAKPLTWFRETLDEAVGAHRVSDVPLGMFLSGGLDSGSMAASLHHSGPESVPCFTMRFDESAYDEGPAAQAMTRRYGLSRFETRLPAEQLLDTLVEASQFADEPLAHGNEAHLLALSRCAKGQATVLLSGEGADEVFGGYKRYQPLACRPLLGGAGRALGHLLGLCPSASRGARLGRWLRVPSLREQILYNACETYPDELQQLGLSPTRQFPYREAILDEAAALYPQEPVRQAMYLDQHTYLCSVLDRTDRMTMAASVECRVPFLDTRLVEGAGALPTGWLRPGSPGKYLIRAAVGDRLPVASRPQRKLGFSVPFAQYLRQTPELRERVGQLPFLPPICDGPLAIPRLQRVCREFLAGDARWTYLVRQLLLLAIWHQELFSARAVAPRRSGRALQAVPSV